MVFSSCLASLGLFLCSVPGFGQTQFNFNRAHSVHLGLVSQHRFFLDLQVKQPIRDLLDNDLPSSVVGEVDSAIFFFVFLLLDEPDFDKLGKDFEVSIGVALR